MVSLPRHKIELEVGKNSRKRRICFKKIVFVFFGTIFIILTTLWLLSSYTLWALYKNDSGLKEWFPNVKDFLELSAPNIIDQNYSALLNVLHVKEPTLKSKLPIVKIYTSKNDLEVLDHRNFLFQLGLVEKRPQIRGSFKALNGDDIPINIRIRGSGSWHHQIWKPSIRVRFKKSRLSDAYRNHILIAPEDGIGLRNWLSTELSGKWDLLNYNEHFIRLLINNRFMGIYNRMWRLGESIFINQRKIPGPILRLELTSKKDFLRSKQNWYIPSAWEVKGVSEKEKIALLVGPTNLAQEILLETIPSKNYQKAVEQMNLLNDYIDRDSFGKYLALLSHATGNHVDDIHNNAFWLDVPTGKLIPLLIDINGYGMFGDDKIQAPIIKTEGAFINAWLLDPRNLALYIDKLNDLIFTFGSIEETEKLLKDKWKDIREDLAADVYLSKIGSPRDLMPLNNLDENFEELIHFINSRIKWIKSQITTDKISIVKVQPDFWEVYIEGFSGFKVKRKDGRPFRLIGLNKSNQEVLLLPSVPRKMKKLTDSTVINPTIKWQTEAMDRIKKFLSPSLHGIAIKLLEDEVKLAGHGEVTMDLLFEHRSVLAGLTNIPEQSISVDVPNSYGFYKLSGKPDDYLFYHRLTNQKVTLTTPPDHLKYFKQLAGLSPLSFSEGNKDPIIIGPEEILITSNKEYGLNQKVTILAGTKFLMGSNASIIFKGPINIEGTKNSPIIVRPLNPEKPFGVFALLGKATKQSRIQYLDIEGGSVYRRNNLKFTGMFSVHDCPDIEISNSRFGRNFIGDDAVHFVRSKVKIKSSIFENALFDAMDLDLVDGEITDSIFKNSGNDGLDISMGTVHVANNWFEKSGDKCISAGEGTQTTIVSSKFQNCNIGIAVKDRSKVNLSDSIFLENSIAYSAYRKKWRWEKGGEGVIKNTEFKNSVRTDIKVDKFSKISFIGSIPENIRTEGKLGLTSNLK
jgi:hypothetical protein